MKKHFPVLIIILALAVPGLVFAEDNIRVVINGEENYFNPSPIVDNGYTLVPMRSFFEALGITVAWEAQTQTAVGTRDNTEIRIMIGSNVAKVNGLETLISMPARIIGGATFIPLRFVAGALGAEVGWDHAVRTITIDTVAGGSMEMDDFPSLEVIKTQTGIASWYGGQFAGRRTASGEVFNPSDFTAAHRELPFGTRVKVTLLKTGRSIIVRVNDRGPSAKYHPERIIDLSQAAAEAIGLRAHGIGEILLEVLRQD